MPKSLMYTKVIPGIIMFSLISITVFYSAYQVFSVKAAGESAKADVWLTTADLSKHLSQRADVAFAQGTSSNPITITVDENKTYQQMDGFGASFTDASAWLVYNRMSTSQRDTLMHKLFDAQNGIGLNFLRQPMGASDLTRPAPAVGEYSYDDVPAGQSDPTLTHFSIAHDSAYIIPVLKQALKINPATRVMATPWSPPGWMKSTGSMEGGTLNTAAYDAYAQYFVRYVQAYQAQGIPIYAVTPQNEPLYVPSGYPGMSFPADQETAFIKNNLGPAFASNQIKTKILGYDHNWDQPAYPTTILSDPAANAYTAGTAWHCYGGVVEVQTAVHNAFPNKDTWETECSGGQWEANNGFPGTMSLLIGVTRNWGKSVVRWGMALDANGQPNLGTGAACSQCRGVVTVDQGTGKVTYNGDYYGLGQASKFVVPGAYHIDSSAGSNGVQDVAFKNPDGSKVLVVYNSSSSSQVFDVQWGGKRLAYTLPAGAAATFKWSGTQSAGGTTDQISLNRTGWTASASVPASPCCTADVPANVLDGNSATRWTSAQPQSPGLWFQVNMDRPHSIDNLSLDASTSYGDYLRNYLVFLSIDGSNWGNPVATGIGTGQIVNISFPTQVAHYIRIVDIGSSGSWWSLNEFTVYGSQAANPNPLDRTNWVASASSIPTDPCCTGDIPSHALDGDSTTRWTSGKPQSAGQWFQVDMSATHSFSSIALDAASSGGDFPRGYQVFVSNDGTNWGSAIATGTGTGAYTTISFGKQSARYIKIVLTSNTGSWWSIHEFYVFS